MSLKEFQKRITLTRMISEALDICESWEISDFNNQRLLKVTFYYNNPDDSVVWKFRTDFFNESLKQLFDACESKNKFHKKP